MSSTLSMTKLLSKVKVDCFIMLCPIIIDIVSPRFLCRPTTEESRTMTLSDFVSLCLTLHNNCSPCNNFAEI